MRFRIARRELMEHAAQLAVNVAQTRIVRSITPADQLRLVDRYASQLGEAP
jgi:F0F1-type ATP synthase membrane subunit b/b'